MTAGPLGMVVQGLKQSWQQSLPGGLPGRSWVMSVFPCPRRVWGGLAACNPVELTDTQKASEVSSCGPSGGGAGPQLFGLFLVQQLC